MEYKIKTLSPVHIGCGEKYNGLNFIIDNGRLYCVEPEKFISMLNSGLTKKFVDWIEKSSTEINNLESKKKVLISPEDKKQIGNEIRQMTRVFNLKKFIEDNKVNLQQITSSAQYAMPVQTGVFNDTEVNPFIKQMNRPYIPGTEIKGAIRTAILYCAIMDNQEHQTWLKDELLRFKNKPCEKDSKGNVLKTAKDYISNVANQQSPDRRKKGKLVDLMSKLEEDFQERVFNSKPKDAKYDLMKFLQVGDTNLLEPAQVLAVTCAKPIGISKPFTTFNEYLKPELEIAISAFKLEKYSHIQIKADKMKFSDAQNKLFSGMDSILKYCYRFANELITEEIIYFKSKANIVADLKSIGKQNTPNTPVLRIGKDEGFFSLTVGMAIKKLMPELYKDVLIHCTKGTSYDSQQALLPKSRKIVHWNGAEMTAGWVQLLPVSDKSQQPTGNAALQDKQTTPHARQTGPVDIAALAARFNKK